MVTRLGVPLVCLLPVAAFETLIRVPGLHLDPGLPTDSVHYLWVLGASFVFAMAASWWLPIRYLWLPVWLGVAAIFCGLSGLFWHTWVSHSELFVLWFVYALLGGTVFGMGSALALKFLRVALAAAILERVLGPFRLGLALGGTVLSIVILQQLGPLRAGVVVGLLLTATSLTALGTLKRLEQLPVPGARFPPLALVLHFCAGIPSLWLLEAWVPRVELSKHENTVLLHRTSTRGTTTLTAGERQFQVFTDGLLRVSSLDEARYFESLVHPAMALREKPQNVLLIASGEPLSAREILRYRSVRELWLVPEHPELLELSRQVRWLTLKSEGALLDPRVRVVDQEALVWLTQTDQRFDVIIVDASDPHDYVAGKYTTHFFFEMLRAHLHPKGLLALQATSSRSPPNVLLDLVATSRSLGFTTLAYNAAVPTLGLWNFLLASPNAQALASTPESLPRGLTYLDAPTLNILLGEARRHSKHLGGGEISYLHRQTVVAALLGEQH
ncbi:MAG: hypothetical protein SFV15_16245 [Polyangiaceae bacterium]|nr:hypothetical protein [Polyangiaceae bacterium]